VNAVGLSAEEFERYIDFIADRRLDGCGLPVLNPGHHQSAALAGGDDGHRKEQNFFEGKVTDYQKSSALVHCSDDDL
jgi:ribonucleoside-diphosphate reductase beta chain